MALALFFKNPFKKIEVIVKGVSGKSGFFLIELPIELPVVLPIVLPYCLVWNGARGVGRGVGRGGGAKGPGPDRLGFRPFRPGLGGWGRGWGGGGPFSKSTIFNCF